MRMSERVKGKRPRQTSSHSSASSASSAASPVAGTEEEGHFLFSPHRTPDPGESSSFWQASASTSGASSGSASEEPTTPWGAAIPA
ncbi:hypothetical protein VPNG_04628 [Cytospora leucostoma]|uniref:Uncharacterized protein n=1 Tax=Cytospora leucostoma TaxID=1230097 RepID=A0A423XC93_9PEZI|nr:hypothetical protein VPNG_04628 [Cytospora leucostoma]